MNENQSKINDSEIYECEECGAEVKIDDKICPKCGADISEIDEDETTENTEKLSITSLTLITIILGSIANFCYQFGKSLDKTWIIIIGLPFGFLAFLTWASCEGSNKWIVGIISIPSIFIIVKLLFLIIGK